MAAIVPPLTVDQAVDAVDPLSSIFLPGQGLTHCNQFARAVARTMGAELPDALANEQIAWLASTKGIDAGWAESSEQAARQWAEGGGLAFACYVNPTGKHGHIAPLVRGAAGVTTIANVGAKNFRRGRLLEGFGNLAVRFFTFHPLRTSAAHP